jgi:uncharacterized coiled-coil protein SlyX
MALIDCPECGTEVSERAAACPQCAYPIARRERGGIRPESGFNADSAFKVTRDILGRVILAGVFFASGVAWEAPPVILGSLVVAGSSIPIWLRARRAMRFGSTSEPKRIAQLEQRINDLEERTIQQVGDIEEMNSRQMAELEDRLDFTERLLMKQREQA